MEPKRELTSVDLAALAGELGRYEGAGVDKAYLYEDGLVRLKMRHYERGRVELLIDVGDTKHVRIADADNVPPAPERPPNFAMMLRNRLAGSELAGVEQFEFDRILQLHFEREDDSTTIVAELFGDGNVAVLDGAGDVVDCLDTVRLKSRTVAPGSNYEFPDARFNPLAVDFEGFAARMDQSDTDVVRTLATQLNFGGLWGEELCTRAGIAKTLDIDEATEEDYRAIYETVQTLAEKLKSGDLDSRVYYETDDDAAGEDTDDQSGRRIDVTPVPLEERADVRPEIFDTFTDALDDYFTHFEADHAEEEAAEAGGRDRPDFEAEIEKKKRIIEQQEGAIENFDDQAEAERQKAEALYGHYDLVDEVLSTVRSARRDGASWDDIEERFAEGAEQGIAAAKAVQSLDGSEGTVTMQVGDHTATLVVSDGVEKNADRLYTEAKRIEEKKEGAQAAIENTREELEEVRERRERWDTEDGGEESESDEDGGEDEDIDWLSRSSIPVRSGEKWYESFRWFHTSDGFLVIGGRNADQNEDLVKKYLEPGDRFFHAQAHGGPVTILKATGPSESADEDIDIPERSEREAAQFAVSYSSVWKDGRFAGDAYVVDPDQVSKTPESGEYLEKGGFAIRGDRTYFRDVPAGAAVGITCEPETRVIGGPPEPIVARAETAITVEPGKYAQNDIAKRLYREFRERFVDDSFVRKVASPDRIQEFLPPGGSRMREE
ncbi:ribosome rescue protein RqcH [Salinibaculum rarum]|uniref:ribosome rescue protein RqcH n=1 Tax=Salinibaculum rarum TaxID=3058903 RepID=UPI00265ED1A7|nr:ribosome rescue protein RqcH [Salinibaculum sp. KK48]